MVVTKSMLGLLFIILVTGCVTGTLPTPLASSQVKAADLGQLLPISAQISISSHLILLEVAQTPQQQATGLMYRTTLALDRGMLFPFKPPQPVKFWMENTLIPLDMVFLKDGVVKSISANVPPCTANPCPTYGPIVPIDQVIELRGGLAAQLGLKVGERVKIQFLDVTK